MGDRFEKVKNHVKEHQTAYCCVATGIVVAGITAIIMRERHATLLRGVDGSEMITVRSLFFSFYSKESGNVVTTVHTGSRGHPGFRVRNFEHNLNFDTQGAASRAFNIPESIMSSHLNGKFDDACGLHFERIHN